jgi:hemerythrin
LNTEDHDMVHLEWTAALEIGHPEIDDDHRAMVCLLNRLYAASSRSDQAAVRVELAALEALTRDHFAREERLMLDIRYEFAARHQKEHVYLFDEISAQIDDLNEGLLGASAIAQFIRRWLMDHVETSDRQLGAALARHCQRSF